MGLRTYHGFIVLAGLLCIGIAAIPGAWAGVAEVGVMRLDYDEGWQRGSEAEEAEDDSLVLREAGHEDGLTVFLPRRAIPLKIDEVRFYDQLERKWRAQYGNAARISALVAAGTTWRVCARPSLDRSGTVFHLVTVRSGRAHHLLAAGSGEEKSLPVRLEALLARISWPASEFVASAAALAKQPSATVPAPAPVGLVPLPSPTGAQGGTSDAVAETPSQSQIVQKKMPTAHADMELGRWRLLRAGRKVSQGPALAGLAQTESTRLGDAGMLLGYGLQLFDNGLEWFVDGYRFDPFVPGKAGRTTFAHAWRMDWTLPTALDPAVGIDIPVHFSDPIGVMDRDGQSGVRVEMRLLCGPRSELAQAFDALEHGAEEAEAALEALARACPGGSGTASTAWLMTKAAERGTSSSTDVAKTVRLAGAPNPPDLPDGQVARLLLSLRGVASRQGDAPGDALLSGAEVYHVFAHHALK